MRKVKDVINSYAHKTAIHYLKKNIKSGGNDLKGRVSKLRRMGTLKTHFGYPERDEFALLNVTIRLAETIKTLKERLRIADPNYQNASFLDASDPDRIVLRSIGSKTGVSHNIADHAVKQVRRVCGFRSSDPRAIKGDIQKMQFRDKRFEHVFCFDTIEHLPNPIMGLNELSRVCNKKVFISIPWVKKTEMHAHRDVIGNVPVVFRFNKKDFAKALTYTDLKVTYYKEIDVVPKILNPINYLIIKKFCHTKYGFYELTKEEANA